MLFYFNNKRVFLEEQMNEKRIPLPRMNSFDKLAFQTVLNYIYTGKMSEKNLTIKRIFDLLIISQQLELICLSKEIDDKLSEVMNCENIGEIYETACRLNEKVIIEKCEQFIYYNLESLIQKNCLSNLSKTCLERIIDRKKTMAYHFEFYILKLMCQWYSMKNMTSIDQNLITIIQLDNLSFDQINNILDCKHSEVIDDKLRLRLLQILIKKLSLQSLGNTNKLASGSFDNTIKIWNLDSSKCVKTLVGHKSSVVSLQLLANNKLASGSFDNTIKIWNLDNGECVKTLVGHTKMVNSLQLIKTT